MSVRIAFFYFMKNDPDKIREVVTAHVAYWKKSSLDYYVGGPFADRSGGLISFEAPGITEDEAIIAEDPFIVHDLIEDHWIKEWLPDR